MARVDFDFDGVRATAARLAGVQAAVAAALPGALLVEGEKVMMEAKRLTPVDTGTLRSSGRVTGPETEGDSVSVRLSFGGAAQEYAIYVHEDLEATHVNGQAKFLEEPVKRHASRFGANVSATLRAALKGA